jgi:hypothetical protein
MHPLGNRRGQRIQWYGDGRIAQRLQDWIAGGQLDSAYDRVSASQIDVELLESAAAQDSAQRHPSATSRRTLEFDRAGPDLEGKDVAQVSLCGVANMSLGLVD